MNLRAILIAAALAVGGSAGAADDLPPVVHDPVGRTPPNHQDSVRLTRLTSAVIPPDGLLTVGLGGRTLSTVLPVTPAGTTYLERVHQKDLFLVVEAVPVSWFAATADLYRRSWSSDNGWLPEDGSGFGDGHWQLTAGHAVLGRTLNLAVFGGGNIPLGSTAKGLGEGVFSPRLGAGATLRIWTQSQVPELRLHVNWARTWNRNEDEGFGYDPDRLQLWPPRYQPAALAGGPGRNDVDTWGAAVEFRKATTSLWAEYSQDRFRDNSTVAAAEQYAGFSAGLRWGVMEGWAVEG
ncbi:MAG TPA: hypothetical protein PLQ13_05975, partial [Candidatus Krumholzibacteria bacterium]|nr:hypothetical protein [Candidatus Krumholzibacteria bacterium]